MTTNGLAGELQILMGDLTLKRIDAIVVGDKVMSHNDESLKLEAAEVLKVYDRPVGQHCILNTDNYNFIVCGSTVEFGVAGDRSNFNTVEYVPLNQLTKRMPLTTSGMIVEGNKPVTYLRHFTPLIWPGPIFQLQVSGHNTFFAEGILIRGLDMRAAP